MNVGFGLGNTFILLTSSWLVALAVHRYRAECAHDASVPILLTMLAGCTFVVIKLFEYRAKIAAGISPVTNNFYMFYYVMTVIHFLHVIAGLVLLGITRGRFRRASFNPRDLKFAESVATFWHMVDLLWVMLFPLFYLVNTP